MEVEELREGDWPYVLAYSDGSEDVPTLAAEETATSTTKGATAMDPFGADDVEKIEAFSEGENEGDNWLLMVKLKNGNWGFVSAGCDYTGWG